MIDLTIKDNGSNYHIVVKDESNVELIKTSFYSSKKDAIKKILNDKFLELYPMLEKYRNLVEGLAFEGLKFVFDIEDKEKMYKALYEMYKNEYANLNLNIIEKLDEFQELFEKIANYVEFGIKYMYKGEKE